VTAEHLAADAKAVVAAGAGAIHVHPRDASGGESLRSADVAQAVEAARPAGVPVGVTTGAWVVPDVGERLEMIAAWTVLPDFASVNLHEDGALQVAELLIARGIGVEAGVWTAASAADFARSGLAPSCLRVLIEPMDREVPAALATVRAIEAVVGDLGVPRLLHGFQTTAWPMLDEALRRGYDSRMGLEDTLVLPDGSPAPGNAELVRVAHSRVRTMGHD
jgi:uncharacterized protein (DUF849 family)